MRIEKKAAEAPLLRKASAVAVVLLLGVMGLSLISNFTEATVTPANPNGVIVSSQRIHENSTGVPIWGFRATSNTGTDTLDSVNLTLVNVASFSMSDLFTRRTAYSR